MTKDKSDFIIGILLAYPISKAFFVSS